MKNEQFTDFEGTMVYSPPEWLEQGRYFGKQVFAAISLFAAQQVLRHSRYCGMSFICGTTCFCDIIICGEAGICGSKVVCGSASGTTATVFAVHQ